MSALPSRISSLAPFLLQSPPGQVENVYNDIAGLLQAEEDTEGSSISEKEVNIQLRKAADPALKDHNEQQFVIVKVQDGTATSNATSTIICQEARIQVQGRDRYRHARLPISFEIDHKTLATSAVESLEHNPEAEPLRRAWDAALAEYIGDRYPDGKAAVFARLLGEPIGGSASEIEPTAAPEKGPASSAEADDSDKKPEEDREASAEGSQDVEDKAAAESNVPAASATLKEVSGPAPLVAHIVGTRLNPRNFWAGRWRGTYTYDPNHSSVLAARYQIVVHYYENGNVQMNYEHSEELAVSGASAQDAESAAKALTKAIEKAEGEIAEGISKQVEELGGDAFRAMRRMLPVTKQKVNWDKLVSYKIGSELSK
ncbi:subunits of heterodimeric actin filament capping protein Capz [Ceraceosorus guamensis]|uniref:Subunits of heterodimeric actin filament capping protein Capz n=1 Tax=Ceraceosorus guamensis TaxID=1522189 RepID=A0A316VR43_9BASI|nr:subunits of heterodimeric actin filament capping protein Capz [Ceraceosorus guamensis]PWN39518.1 subunits of heterodimeric actin filament capping protein Capz [Ceraceosorus guamensis]